MAAVCDGCKTKKNVKRAFITFWNGNILDLCYKCAVPYFGGMEGKRKRPNNWLDNNGER
jgi:hypothetical protein